MKKCYECRDLKKDTKPRKNKFLHKVLIFVDEVDLCNDCYKFFKITLTEPK